MALADLTCFSFQGLTICLTGGKFFSSTVTKIRIFYFILLSLILSMFVYKLLVLFGVKAWYVQYGKCSLTVRLCLIL